MIVAIATKNLACTSTYFLWEGGEHLRRSRIFPEEVMIAEEGGLQPLRRFW